MTERVDRDRRRYLGAAAMAIAAAPFGLSGTAQANPRVSRQFSALGAAQEWLNSPLLAPSSLAGKVVVVNFWTYTCINWLRTLPYLRAWAARYRESLVMIGVHTPEFGFERDLDNVRRAVRQMRIEYPVVLDNDYTIWRAFKNQYWPALYFMDARGRVRQHHFGEGKYEESELAIQRLVAETGISEVRGSVVAVDANGFEAAPDWQNLRSPETYLGYDRARNFASRGGAELDRRRVYAAPARSALNTWALAGEWTIGKHSAVLSSAKGRLVHRFHARDLYLVMGPLHRGSPVRFRVSIDGQPPAAARGLDIDEGGNGVAVEQRLYQLIRQPRPIVERQFEIEFLDAGVETFAFTFG
jgi:thiol-disulfide isomerase/thioredoxin